MTERVSERLPCRGVICFKSATHIPCNDGSRGAVVHFSRRVVHFLEAGRIGTVIVTYGATDTLTLSTIGSRFRLPVVKMIVPKTETTMRTAAGKGINIMNARTAIRDKVCAGIVRKVGPGVRIVRGTYPLFMPLIRRKFGRRVIAERVVRCCLRSVHGASVSTVVLNYARCPLLESGVERCVKSGVRVIGPTCRATVSLGHLLRRRRVTGSRAARRRDRCSFCIDSTTRGFEGFTGAIVPFSIPAAGMMGVRRCWLMVLGRRDCFILMH